MAVSIALGANINSALNAQPTGTVFKFAAGTYYGQQFTPLQNQVLIGDPSGGTIISGAWKVTTWAGSGATWNATQGITDLGGTANLPAIATAAVCTASLNTTGGGHLVVTAIASGAIQIGSQIFNAAGTITQPTTITSQISGTTGAAGTYQLNRALTVASAQVLLTPGNASIANGGNAFANYLECLWVDNVMYTRVAAPGPAGANTWWWNTATHSINVNIDLTTHLVEYAQVSVVSGSFPIGGEIDNIIFEKYAPGFQTGIIHGPSGWTLRNCGFNKSQGTGLIMGQGPFTGGAVSKAINCKFLSNGQEGIGGANCDNCVVSNCESAFNNTAGYDPENDAGGMKFSACNNMEIIGNKVHDNISNGIWFDGFCSGNVIAKNRVYGNKSFNGEQGCGAGIMYEISYGNTKIYNNYVSGNWGPGIYISNSSGVEVSGNTVFVGTFASNTSLNGGINILNADRTGDGPGLQSSNCNVHDNIIVHTSDTAQDGTQIYLAIVGSLNLTWNNNTYIVPSAGTFWEFDNPNGSAGGAGTFTWAALQASGNGYDTTSSQLIGIPATLTTILGYLADGQVAGNITPAKFRIIEDTLVSLLGQAAVPFGA